MRPARIAALAVVGFALLASTGVSRLSSSSHYNVYFDAADPALVDHTDILQTFGRGEALVVLLQTEGETFLAPSMWRLLEALSDALRDHPQVSAAVAASELGIGGVVETPSGQLIPDRDALEQHGRVFGLLLSDDARLAALVVDVQLPDHAAETVLGVVTELRTVVSDGISGQPVRASYTGTMAMSAAYVEVVRGDLRVIIPLLLITLFVLLGVLLGGFRAVVAVLPIGLLAVFAAFGIAGWFGATLAAINTFAPIMILSISLAGCVHLVLAYQRARNDGIDTLEAAGLAREHVLLPMTIASGTTMLGFLALLLSPSPPLRIVGYTVATGIAVAWLACILILPGLLARLDPRQSRAFRSSIRLRGLVDAALRWRRTVLVVAAAVAFASALLVTQNRVSDSVFEYFPAEHAFVAATRTADDQLAGVNEILVRLDANQPEALLEESTVRSIEVFTDWLQGQPEVRRVSSLLDTDIVRTAIDGERLAERLDRFRGRGVTGLERRELAADRSAMLLTVYVDVADSYAMVELDRRIRLAAAEQLPDIDTTTGGASLIFAKLGEQNIRSMLLALSLGLVVAAFVFGMVLRSVTVAVVGLACNVLPVLAVYAVWAVADGSISLGAATVMGMILGIVIDDTVYLLTAWWRHRHCPDASLRAVAETGPALVTTSIVLSAGLAAGLLSDFLPVWSMSALSVGIILTASLIDLVALPAMLERVRRDA